MNEINSEDCRKCPVCGQTVTADTMLCPDCGCNTYPVEKKKQRKNVIPVVLFFAICLFLGIARDRGIWIFREGYEAGPVARWIIGKPAEEEPLTESEKKAKELAEQVIQNHKDSIPEGEPYIPGYYLSLDTYSYEGLVEQLVKMELYTEESARAAADKCGADWNEQALRAAKKYLDLFTLSEQGLREWLQKDRFTEEQIDYAVKKCGADWNEQAKLKAEYYMGFLTLTRLDLVERLQKYDDFTAAQAEYAAANIDVDWDAMRLAKMYYLLEDSSIGYSRPRMAEWLVEQGCTEEEAEKVLSNADIDWNAQAVKDAKFFSEYVSDYASIKASLINSGFTPEQAKYGAEHYKDE